MPSPRPQRSARAHPLRRVFAPLFALLLATFALMPMSAMADPNRDIVVGVTEVQHGSGPGGQLVVGDKAIISGTWDASTANPQAGDEFTIGLPDEFSFEEPISFQLMGADEEGAPTVWGNCTTDPGTGVATCTLTDAVVDLDDVMGTWEFEITVDEATTEDEVVFDLNGVETPVELPGGGGIDPGAQLPDAVSKSGVMNDNNWSMTWTVDIPGPSLDQAGGDAHISDTFGAGHVLCDPTNFKVVTVNANGAVTGDVTDLVAQRPAAGGNGFDIVLAEPTAGWDTGATYRVTYDTCTIDRQIDAPNTTYDNSMQIEGWGAVGEGIGEVTNKPWKLDLSKGGTVLGGSDRNGKVRWTVQVPGDELFGQGSFTFSESFGGGHELCGNTISGIKITERYGPTSQRDTDVTGKLTPGVISQSSSGFDMTFTINDPGFSFKASDWRYIITYDTCVTETELPGGGVVYTNKAAVDGKTTEGTSTVPGRKSDKTGALNNSPVTIDGVEYDPQTTLNWTVTIPGRDLEEKGLAGALSLVDTLSDTHTVCAPGDTSGGLAARLNLKVEARDQIQNGGLTTQNLTGETSVARAGQELTFTLNQTDLPVPGGTSTGFSREYQYVFTYTTCTTSGGMDAPGTQYSNEIGAFGPTFKPTVTQNNRGSGTGQGKSRGSVAVKKDLTDNAAANFVPAGTTFKVHVKEIDPNDNVVTEYDLDVPLDGTPVSGFNSRGNGWTFELSEPTLPNIPGVTWGAPAFAASEGVTVNPDDSVATAAIAPRSNIAVQLTNTAQLGSIEIVKAVAGGAADQVPADRAYLVTAEIDTAALGNGFPAQADRVLTLVDGEPQTLTDLPIGATVNFSELRPADDDLFTWGAPVITPESLTVTAAHATTPAQVTVTNSVVRTVGTFSIVKTVTGAQAANPAVPATVTVTATWDEEGTPGTKTLTVPTDGTPEPLDEDLLIGTEVTLTETPLIDGSSIAWGAPVWSGPGVTIDGRSAVVTVGRDSNATITLENHAATSVAGLSLIKGVGGEAAEDVPAGTEFPVTATWTIDGDDFSKEFTINSETPTGLGVDLPAGTVVTITEGERPGFPTVVWGSITITGDDVTDAGDGSAEIIVSDLQSDTTLVTVTNEATWAPGTLSLAKLFDGVSVDHADVPETFTVNATWTIDGEDFSKEIPLPADGTVVNLEEDLPYGTQVLLTEVAPEDTASFTWETPTWSGEATANGDGTATVTIGAATTSAVELTNTANDKLGSLTLRKKLAGSGADDVPARTKFPVTLTWTDLLGESQEREVTVKAGKPITVRDLPVGAEITVAEDGSDVGDLTWVGVEWTSKADNVDIAEDGDGAVVTVTGDDGASAEITVVNTFDAPDLEDVDDNNDDRGNLPDTGSSVSPGWIALGLLSVAAGAGLLLANRRRRSVIA